MHPWRLGGTAAGHFSPSTRRTCLPRQASTNQAHSSGPYRCRIANIAHCGWIPGMQMGTGFGVQFMQKQGLTKWEVRQAVDPSWIVQKWRLNPYGKAYLCTMTILASTTLPTEFGSFHFMAFGTAEHAGAEGHPHVALHRAQPAGITDLRIHSECMSGDVFSSVKCDCGPQLHAAMSRFGSEGGLLIYLRQEGRGIGLVEKIKAYELQAAGRDTLDANLELGHGADDRQYDSAIWLLKELGIQRVRLHSNNPEKVSALRAAGIEVVERIPLEVGSAPENAAYLRTKRDRMGHLLHAISMADKK